VINEPYQARLELFPITTRLERVEEKLSLTIAGCNLVELVETYGTPLYLYDRSTLDACVRSYKQALSSFYPAASGITYASKAFLCLAIAQWCHNSGLLLDCTGAGELAVAQAAGVPRGSILVHGVNKSEDDLVAALKLAGTVVVDNLTELQRIIEWQPGEQGQLPDLWLRLRPGKAVDTHTYTQTGQDDSKFGMSPGEITQAVRICQAHQLPLTGLHFHQGSHFHDPAPLRPAIETALNLLVSIQEQTGWYPATFCTGGGWGIPYHERELPHPHVESYIQVIAESILSGCRECHLPLPRLQVEPGRSLVARAGVAIYQVGVVKRSAQRRWLLLDGGMADNPRPALYRANYSALPILNPDRPFGDPAWLAGPFCESGDVLIEALPMPEIAAGEFVAIPVSGAYQLSMGSNYNGAQKPAVLWLDHGEARLIQRRETPDDLFRRDLLLYPKQ
jgi:diaminopimelate decarboxylase